MQDNWSAHSIFFSRAGEDIAVNERIELAVAQMIGEIEHDMLREELADHIAEEFYARPDR